MMDSEVEDDDAADSDDTADSDDADDSGDADDSDNPLAPSSCEEIAALFQTLGSANPDLPEPFVSATCSDDGGMVTVESNGIPDFPYIATSPGVPTAFDLTYTFPTVPTVADTTTAIPIVGAIGVAVNGVPIFGPTEGPGGDVQARPGGFTECGGHNGPSTYHYHLFLVTGSDRCRFSEADGRVIYGYALDGYPIYGGYDYTSSYELTDESLFDSDTWAAHTYVEGLGDLDECNGLIDENGNYGYYATEGFPYLLGCFRGEPQFPSM
ncbi:MAG: YHYH protein [Myxococcota bacterium]